MSADQEIDELRSNPQSTLRNCSPALEEILYKKLPVLDHGFIRVVDYMGDDSSIVQAARVSYGKGTKKLREDQGLINYLLRHSHTTPFEMCDIKLHVKLPIFIARQWLRHRTASVNEYSARYSILAKEFYIPLQENLAIQSKINKQGRGDILQPNDAQKILDIMKSDAERCYDNYELMLNENENGETINPEKDGLTRELARMNLTLNYYTEFYWKINLHNLMHFVKLRADSHAQYEIRAYAEIMLGIIKKWVPFTYEAFEQYVIGGTKISANALKCLKMMLNQQAVSQESSGMGIREWQEFCQTFDIKSE
jgi:thymidylate synthase (FAD)